MKKLVLPFLVLVVIALFCVYIFIPNSVEIRRSKFVGVNLDAARRTLKDEDIWQKWWPNLSRDNQSNTYLGHNNTKFSIVQEVYNGYQFVTVNKKDSIHTVLHLIPLPGRKDSTLIVWEGSLETSSNPFTRLSIFLKGKEIESDMGELISKLGSYLSSQENVYGMKIERVVVSDTLLIYKERNFFQNPSTTEIYDIVKNLQNSINSSGLRQTGYPMLNIFKVDTTSWRAMVAIPVNKQVPLGDSISYRKMVRGWILVAEINGGQFAIQKAYAEMNNYVTDYGKTPIAMPFESLVTDRSTQEDTTKWVTRIYFPVVL